MLGLLLLHFRDHIWSLKMIKLNEIDHLNWWHSEFKGGETENQLSVRWCIWLLYVSVQCMSHAQNWNNTCQSLFFNKSCVLSWQFPCRCVLVHVLDATEILCCATFWNYLFVLASQFLPVTDCVICGYKHACHMTRSSHTSVHGRLML
jgi:hypothetical protein